jgi:predicted dehydrogenase
MSQQAIDVAVIGWGNFFKHIHEQTLHDLIVAGRCRLRAVCVRTAATREALVQTHGADYGTADYRQVLADPQVDAILIGAPHDVQAQYALDAVRAGKWVYVEKPMFAAEATPAKYFEQFRQLGAAATERLAVGLNKRFAPAYRQLHELAAGWQGIKSLRMSIVDDAWRWGAKYPPGFLFWLDVCHWTDLARWFTGSEIAAVSCLNPQVEDSLVTMKMSDDTAVTIFLSGNGTMDMIKDELHITTGGRRCASVFDYVEMEIFGGAQREVHQYPANLQYGGDEKYVQAITAGGLDALRGIRREMYDRYLRVQQTHDAREEAYLKRNLPNFMRPQGWKESLTYFVETVRAARPLQESAGYRDAYISYLFLEAAKHSVAQGGAFVPMPDVQ